MSSYYDELAEYTGLDVNLVNQLCQSARFHLAKLWHTKKSVEDFYSSTDLYLYDLTMYAVHLQQRGTYRWFRQMLRDKNIKTMVDYGGGIGEYSVVASQEGMDCFHYDLPGPLRDYALWRFDMHKSPVNVIADEKLLDTVAGEVDLYVCMDVFEHLEDPQPVIAEIAKKCRYIMCNPEEIQYNWSYPMHISKFTLEPHFTKIDKYLYKSNRGQETA